MQKNIVHLTIVLDMKQKKVILVLILVYVINEQHQAEGFFGGVTKWVNKVTHKAEKGIKQAVHKTSQGFKVAEHETKKFAYHAVHETEKGVDRVGQEIEKGGNKAVHEIEKTSKQSFNDVVDITKKAGKIFTDGCCGLHPSYCKNQKEFARLKDDLNDKIKTMNKTWKKVLTKMGMVKKVDLNNKEIYKLLQQITVVSEQSMKTIDPEIKTRIDNVLKGIKDQISANNKTVMNYGIKEIGNEIDKTEGTFRSQLFQLTGIEAIETTIKVLADMFKLVKVDSIVKFLDDDILQFLEKAKSEVSKLFGFKYLEEKAKTDTALKIMYEALKIYNEYINIFNQASDIIKAFGDFAKWIQDLATCEKKRKELENALHKLQESHSKVNRIFEKLQIVKLDVDRNWKLVFNEAKSPALLSHLMDIENIPLHSSVVSPALKYDADRIKDYRIHIGNSTTTNVKRFQQSLIEALENIHKHAPLIIKAIFQYL